MSIRAFTNQPCPDCKADTLHFNMQCRTCGHINLTPTQHRSVGFKRHMVMTKFKPKTRLTRETRTAMFIGRIKAREVASAAVKSASARATCRGSMFGKGKGIPRI